MAKEWLVWLGWGVSASLQSLRVRAIVAQLIGAGFHLQWAILNLNKRSVMSSILYYVTDVFFKKVEESGSEKIPEGPVILACAPHANQFLDPIVVQRCAGRHISYLAAKTSLRRPYIGAVANIFDPIGVERPQDLATAGQGKVTVQDTVVRGVGTRFTEQVRKGDSIVISIGQQGTFIAGVLRVDDDDTIMLKSCLGNGEDTINGVAEPHSFKVHPHIDHSEMYASVAQHLKQGGAVGVFPEGGSHDRTELLTLKAGVAIMALEACSKLPGLDLKVVPVGLNYFNGHRFRSRVFVEFGDPIQIQPEWVDQYNLGGEAKRAVCEHMLQLIETALHQHTVQTPDVKTLVLLNMLRQLYAPAETPLPIEEAQALTRCFADAYLKEGTRAVEEELRVAHVVAEVNEYMSNLQLYNVSDQQVACRTGMHVPGMHQEKKKTWMLNKAAILRLFLMRLGISFFHMASFVPGMILALPCTLLTKYISSKKAREALAKSSVKVAGRDVIATWKVMVGFVFIPILHVFYTAAIWIFSRFYLRSTTDARRKRNANAAAVIYFFFMPFISAGSILAFENFRRNALTLRPLFLLLTNSRSADRLAEMRQDLVVSVRELVNELEWIPRSSKGLMPVLKEAGALPVTPVASPRTTKCDRDGEMPELSLPDSSTRSRSRNLTELNAVY